MDSPGWSQDGVSSNAEDIHVADKPVENATESEQVMGDVEDSTDAAEFTDASSHPWILSRFRRLLGQISAPPLSMAVVWMSRRSNWDLLSKVECFNHKY